MSNDENTAILSGTLESDAVLDHELFGEEFYAATLMVPRLSGTVDLVPVTFPGRALPFFPLGGDRITVTGQVRSYNRRGESGNRLAITLFAQSVELMDEAELPQNDVIISGYLCKPAVFRVTPFLREIGDMLIACNRAFNKSDYLPCIAWGRNARIAEGIPVGSRVRIEGRLQSRRYQKTLGNGMSEDRTAYEISCSTIEQL